eukprot:11325515-Prorocentrum_lima.AAC.1
MDAQPALALALPADAAPPPAVVSSDVSAGDPSSGADQRQTVVLYGGDAAGPSSGQQQTLTLYNGELEISGIDLDHEEAVAEAASSGAAQLGGL